MSDTDWRQVGTITSNICGWLYFIAWSLSFYPQPFLNLKRQSTEGLTPDFPKLNVLGFTAYSISVTALLYSPTVRSQYAARHPASPIPTTRFNDVAFGIHALILCIITYSQFYPRLWGWAGSAQRRATRVTDGLVLGSSVAIGIVALFILTQPTWSTIEWQALDLIYTLQYIKLALTVFKYIPQVVSNARRKSTAGWSMGQIQCDTVGGVLSLAQLLIDSSLQADWSGLFGNPVKLGLANISLAFDLIFIVQHYVLYGPVETEEPTTDREHAPLLHDRGIER